MGRSIFQKNKLDMKDKCYGVSLKDWEREQIKTQENNMKEYWLSKTIGYANEGVG